MHVVTRGHFWSRGEDGCRITVIAEKPMLHANFTALCDIKPDLLPIKVLHSSYDLDLDSMTFIYELDPYPVQIYRVTKNVLPASRLSKVIVLQTDRHTYAMEIIYHAASRVVSNKIHTRNKSMKTIAYIFKITIGNFWFLINRINTDRRAAFLRHPGLLFNIDNAGELADIAGSLCCSQFQQPD